VASEGHSAARAAVTDTNSQTQRNHARRSKVSRISANDSARQTAVKFGRALNANQQLLRVPLFERQVADWRIYSALSVQASHRIARVDQPHRRGNPKRQNDESGTRKPHSHSLTSSSQCDDYHAEARRHPGREQRQERQHSP